MSTRNQLISKLSNAPGLHIMTLKKIFGDHVSSSAFQVIDGEIRIVGKFAQITLMDDELDIWFIKPNFEPIGERKLSNLIKAIPHKLTVNRLNGEAWFKCKEPELICELLILWGVRKRRFISETEKKRLSEQIKQATKNRDNESCFTMG